jgi:ATP-dependent Lon protease
LLEGAIPKDGPSAGIALATALASLLSQVPVDGRIAMTGELTLRGKVLPIGGVKEKVLAAYRFGMKTVVLPRENEKDLAEIPDDIGKEISFHLVESLEQVLDLAFVRDDAALGIEKRDADGALGGESAGGPVTH